MDWNNSKDFLLSMYPVRLFIIINLTQKMNLVYPIIALIEFLKINKVKFGWGFRDGGLARFRSETNDFQRYLCTYENNESSHNNAAACPHGVVDIQEDIYNDSLLWLGTHIGLIRFNKFTADYDHFMFDEGGIRNSLNSVRCLLAHKNGKAILWYLVERELSFLIQLTESFSYLKPCFENGTAAFDRDVILGFLSKR